MKRWREDRGRWLEARGLPATEDLSESLARLSADQRRAYLREFGRRFHELLDSGHGSCLLRNPAHSEVVATALECFDGQRYELEDYVVMPNHVHVLVAPREGYSLSAILHSWKRFSAREINRRAGQEGQLWQHESFDHLVRGAGSMEGFVRYIRENPVKAGLRAGEYCLRAWSKLM